MVLLGAAKPDRIELETGLRRWTECRGFWMKRRSRRGAMTPGKPGHYPGHGAWAIVPTCGRCMMTPAATGCHRRSSSPQLVDAIERQKTLTSGASAAGARVQPAGTSARHRDDGALHYAVLGPRAASDPGKPSAEARRFIEQRTTPDYPRVCRNAVVLTVPSRDGLEAARTRVRDYLGWEEVRAQLQDQPIDPLREQVLIAETATAGKRVPDAVRSAYCMVVTVSESDAIHAFRIVVGDEPLFTTIKADRRSRIQETAISAEAMLPGGPYDLWREDEQSRRVKDLVGAFAQFPKLPKMLRTRGNPRHRAGWRANGIWVARLTRPDRTIRTYWRTGIDEPALDDPGLELVLPEAANLSTLDPDLLRQGNLPGLWESDAVSVQEVYNYFAGGHEVVLPREGYEETLRVPACEPAYVDAAVEQAVERGLVWMTNGPASILSEAVPAGVLSAARDTRPPPERIPVDEIMDESIPDAWRDKTTNALAVATALSTKHGATLPWPTVRAVIEDAIRAHWVELSTEDAAWPCELAGARYVNLTVPSDDKPGGGHRQPHAGTRPGVLTAEAVLEANGIQDLADQIPEIAKAAVGNDLKFNVRVEFGGADSPLEEAVARINDLLSDVSDTLRLR